MRKAFVSLILLLFIMGLAFVTFADEKNTEGMPQHEHAGMKGCEGGHSHMSMFKKLGLNDQQKEAIKAIHLRIVKEMVKMKADIKVAEIELREILSKDPVDMSAAQAAVKKIAGLRADMKIMHIKAMQEIKSNLTDEQKKKFKEIMMHKRMHRMTERRWHRCGCHERHWHHRGGMMKKKEMHHDKE